MPDLSKLVIKTFPETRNMQLVCLRAPGHFRCSRCGRSKTANLLAVVSEDWNRLLCKGCYGQLLEEPEEPIKDVIPKDWLGTAVSVQDAEEDNMVGGVPFGELSDEWEEFKSAMIEGDSVWGFCSPPDSWQNLAGRAGYALLRNGSVVKCITVRMN